MPTIAIERNYSINVKKKEELKKKVKKKLKRVMFKTLKDGAWAHRNR